MKTPETYSFGQAAPAAASAATPTRPRISNTPAPYRATTGSHRCDRITPPYSTAPMSQAPTRAAPR